MVVVDVGLVVFGCLYLGLVVGGYGDEVVVGFGVGYVGWFVLVCVVV